MANSGAPTNANGASVTTVIAPVASTTPHAPIAMLYGAGKPTNDFGVEGAFYRDMNNDDMYGPKANGVWPDSYSIRGWKGDKGDVGPKGDLTDVDRAYVDAAKTAASASQVAAAASQGAALASQNAAKGSETNAKASETNAKNSESAAWQSADYANTFQYQAAGSATQAENSKNAAAGSAGVASGAASAAELSKQAAAASASAASGSTTTAASARDAASRSAQEAAASAVAAASSSNGIGVARDAAAASAAAAAASATIAVGAANSVTNPVSKYGDTMTGALSIDTLASATKAQVNVRGASGTSNSESKVRFWGTFGSVETGQRLIASIRSGFNGTGIWGSEYFDIYLNKTGNDTADDANQARALRLAGGGRMLVGPSGADDGTSRLQVEGTGRFAGAVQSSGLDSAGQFRAVAGNYGALLRNDGSNVYLMQTAGGDQYGTFNGYRPFSWSLTTGAVSVDGSGAGTRFGGSATVAGELTSQSVFSNTSGTIYNYGWGGSNGKAVYVFSQDGSKYLLNDGTSYTLAGGGLDVRGPVSAVGTLTTTSGQMVVSGWNNNPSAGVIYFGAAAYNKYLYYDGTNFNFSGGAVTVNGGTVWHSVNLPNPMQSTGAAMSGSLEMSSTINLYNANVLRLWGQGNTYGQYLRGDSGGTVGFINSANNQWNMQLSEDGTATFRGGVYAGNGSGRLAGDGNIYGTAWGSDYLSNWLNNQFSQRDNSINGKAPVRNWSNANYGYVGSDTGQSIILNWDGNVRFYIDGQYGSALWGEHNLNPNSFQPSGSYMRQSVYNDGVGFGLVSGNTPSIASITSQPPCLVLQNGGNNSASCVINFRREGSFAAFFGLDTDNQWAVGGGSHGGVRYRLWHEGNLSPASAGATVRRTGTFELADIDGHANRAFQDAPDNAVVVGFAVSGWYGPNGDCVGAVRLRVSRLVNQ